MKSMRPTLYGNRHAVSAGHYLAAAAGFAILEAGGNAIDAGCATGIALAVLHPDEVNVAGVAPIMIRTGPHGEKGGKVVTIAGLGHWPKRFPADLFMREHGGKMPLGILRTVVPAAPDAWITALSDYGTMSFGDVADAAIRHARDGFAVFEYMATMIKQYEDGYRSWPSNGAADWRACRRRAPPSIAAISPRRSCAITSRRAAGSGATISPTSTAAT